MDHDVYQLSGIMRSEYDGNITKVGEFSFFLA